MADFSNGSWWISSFASGSCRKSIRNGGFTIKKWWFCHQQNGGGTKKKWIQFDLQYFHYPLNYPKPTSLAPENPRSQRKDLFSNSSTHGYVARSSTLVVGSPMTLQATGLRQVLSHQKPQAKVPWQHMDPSCGIKQLGMDTAIPKGQPWKADYRFFFCCAWVRPSPTSPWSLENQSQHSQWNLVLLINHPIFSIGNTHPGAADLHQVKILQHIRGSQNHPLGDPASCTSPNPPTSSEISTWTHLWCDGAIVMAPWFWLTFHGSFHGFVWKWKLYTQISRHFWIKSLPIGFCFLRAPKGTAVHVEATALRAAREAELVRLPSAAAAAAAAAAAGRSGARGHTGTTGSGHTGTTGSCEVGTQAMKQWVESFGIMSLIFWTVERNILLV